MPRGMARRSGRRRRGLPLAEAASFALAAHLPRAEAQKLVKAGLRAKRWRPDRDLLAILAERAPSLPIDWPEVRRRAEHPACAAMLIDRVLAEAHGTGAVAP